ncbi:hypothetical protein N7510_007134 [Penicillium lagena]|uniref:uncharacterized protein n=1 Tax=Penicillium lagena TaxID=94218 RepID=UPI0025416A6F|nr:uncharacterized protein N7510_007134 [Penicillium lagena]KAJ5610415.1 hypothetical protein N7510_007134 [Penicillium lagena]
MFLLNYATQVLCFILVTSFVFLRFLVRWKLSGTLGIDDACCLIGWVLFMGFCAIALVYGFKGVIGYYTIITFIKMFICNPISAYWILSQKPYSICLSEPGVIIADSAISFLTDIAIFAFPITFIWPLQMPLWKKVKVIALLGLGGIALAFSLYQLIVAVYEIKRPDDTTVFTRSILTANAEVGIGLICSCMPALNILTKHTQQDTAPWKGLARRHKKNHEPMHTIFDGTQSSRFVTSHLSTSARRGSTDAAGLMARYEQLHLSARDNTESIIKIVSLNQYWEQASQSNKGTNQTDIM